jgi:hypothetical protein
MKYFVKFKYVYPEIPFQGYILKFLEHCMGQILQNGFVWKKQNILQK